MLRHEARLAQANRESKTLKAGVCALLLLSLTFILAPAWGQIKKPPGSPHMLPYLAELTLERSPIVQRGKGLVEIARLEMRNAGSQWLPKLDVDTTLGYQGTDPGDPARRTPYQSLLNLVATENLYDNGASITQYQIAKRKFERVQLEFEQSRDQQLLNVATLYYDWSASLQAREILENKRDLLRRQFNVLESQYKQGLKTKRDVLRIETEMRRLELDVINKDNEIDSNFQKLSAFVGVPRSELDKEEIVGEDVKPTIPDSKNVELKAENHRRARIFKLNENEQSLQVRLADRNYWPQVNVAGSVGFHNHDYIDNAPATWETNKYWDWTALVTLKYNLWDFGVQNRLVEIARVTERNLTNFNRQALLDLNKDLRDVILQMRSLRENVKLTRDLLVLEQQSYSMLETEYRNGRASYLDLITNLNSLIDARSKFMVSYFGLKKQLALYSFHQGDLYNAIKQK